MKIFYQVVIKGNKPKVFEYKRFNYAAKKYIKLQTENKVEFWEITVFSKSISRMILDRNYVNLEKR